MASPQSSPARGLTPKSIEALRPRDQRYDVSDGGASGLVLRVHPSGVKSFRWQVRALNRVIVIGPWAATITPAHVTLKEARDWLDRLKEGRTASEAQLDEVLGDLRRHLEPPAEQAEPQGDSVTTIAEEFYRRRIVPHRKRPDCARDVLDRDILPVIGGRSIVGLTTRDCAGVVERVVDRGATVHAGKVLGTLKQFLRFAQARGYTDKNPAAPLDPKDLGIEVNVTTRWLTAEEIPLLWRALDVDRSERAPDKNGKVQSRITMSPAARAGLRLLLMTGVRTGELLLARWEHVDLEGANWTIPVANQKLTRAQERKAKPFVIPLVPSALALFRELQTLAGKSPWVMASEEADGGHFTDKSLGRAMRRLFENKNPILTLPGGPASPHDLRRTVRTHLGKLRVPLHIVERCLNHSLGRIVQTYDQGDYLDERREALEKWDAYVQRLVSPEQSNVAFLPAGA
jgi:integrase